MSEIEDRVDALEARVSGEDVPTLAGDVHLVGEALGIIWGILDDLVTKVAAEDRSEYAEDLDRLHQIAALVR